MLLLLLWWVVQVTGCQQGCGTRAEAPASGDLQQLLLQLGDLAAITHHTHTGLSPIVAHLLQLMVVLAYVQ
jgi:hypothetical protein